ncbi:MAG: hypothetical protein PHR77_09850 [Kiritimatiellae bacterium]|nr:hypothetical protein [Kiritimatiellia bacterium]MDD5522600.1 hypothetical protein [Kiritimatiellia bacterium]
MSGNWKLIGDTHDFTAPGFPYQFQFDLLMDAGWIGWWFPMNSINLR